MTPQQARARAAGYMLATLVLMLATFLTAYAAMITGVWLLFGIAILCVLGAWRFNHAREQLIRSYAAALLATSRSRAESTAT